MLGNSALMISSVCESLVSKRTGDASQRSASPQPWLATSSIFDTFCEGHGDVGTRFAVTVEIIPKSPEHGSLRGRHGAGRVTIAERILGVYPMLTHVTLI